MVESKGLTVLKLIVQTSDHGLKTGSLFIRDNRKCIKKSLKNAQLCNLKIASMFWLKKYLSIRNFRIGTTYY